MLNTYIKYCIFIAILTLFGWLYVNTCLLTDYTKDLQMYQNRVDSLETKVSQMEYLITNEQKQITINIIKK